jgi:hypothetical protein
MSVGASRPPSENPLLPLPASEQPQATVAQLGGLNLLSFPTLPDFSSLQARLADAFASLVPKPSEPPAPGPVLPAPGPAFSFPDFSSVGERLRNAFKFTPPKMPALPSLPDLPDLSPLADRIKNCLPAIPSFPSIPSMGELLGWPSAGFSAELFQESAPASVNPLLLPPSLAQPSPGPNPLPPLLLPKPEPSSVVAALFERIKALPAALAKGVPEVYAQRVPAELRAKVAGLSEMGPALVKAFAPIFQKPLVVPPEATCWEKFIAFWVIVGNLIKLAFIKLWDAIVACCCPDLNAVEASPYVSTAEQTEAIFELITTLARYPNPTTWEKVRYLLPLHTLRDKIHVMHPLKLLEEIFGNKLLRPHVPVLIASNIREQFLPILFDSLEWRYQANDLNRHVARFCDAMRISPDEVQRIINGRAASDQGSNYWLALINFLNANVK